MSSREGSMGVKVVTAPCFMVQTAGDEMGSRVRKGEDEPVLAHTPSFPHCDFG